MSERSRGDGARPHRPHGGRSRPAALASAVLCAVLCCATSIQADDFARQHVVPRIFAGVDGGKFNGADVLSLIAGVRGEYAFFTFWDDNFGFALEAGLGMGTVALKRDKPTWGTTEPPITAASVEVGLSLYCLGEVFFVGGGSESVEDVKFTLKGGVGQVMGDSGSSYLHGGARIDWVLGDGPFVLGFSVQSRAYPEVEQDTAPPADEEEGVPPPPVQLDPQGYVQVVLELGFLL